MKIYLCVAQGYNDFPALFKTLNTLQIKDVVVSKYILGDHLESIKYKLKPKLISKALLYNFLRDEADLVIICTDGEDTHSIYTTKYAINHRLPVLMLTNLEPTYLEVV